MATHQEERAGANLSYWEAPDDLEPGEGAVIRRGLKKVTVYRDESGELHEMTAVCPHLKCIVHWNRTETTWDCPCHGSRFDALGKDLNGPSIADLAAVGEKGGWFFIWRVV